MEPLSPEEKLRELMAQRDETAAQRAREEAELASLQSGTNDALARLADIEAKIGGGSAPKPPVPADSRPADLPPPQIPLPPLQDWPQPEDTPPVAPAPRPAGPSRREAKEARRAEQEAENKKWNLEVAERIRRRIREEEGRRGTLEPEEKQAVARVIFLQSKEERQQAELESSGKISRALEKTGKWWSEDLEKSNRGKWAKVAISSALIGSTTLAGAAIFGIVPPPSGIARRLLLRVGMATGLNMLMTSNIPGKLGSKNQAGSLRGHFNSQKFQYLAMAGGLGAVFLFSGGAVAVTAVGAGGIALRKLFSKMLDTAISEGEKYREDELQAISRASVDDDNFDINDLASELERLGKYYDDVSRKIAVIKRLKNVGNAVVTIVTGITTISVATEHAMAEQAGQPAEQPETPEEQEPAPAPEDITTQAEDKSLLERLKEKIGLGEKDEESTPDKPEEAEPKQTPPSRRGGPGTPAPAPAQPVTPAVPVVAPGAGREISENFRVVLGEDGVPQNIETVFNQISASHLSLPPEGMNEEFAAKSLNMAANLVRLSEGHGVAGITQAEWGEAGNFWDGRLTIRDHEAFNKILARLEGHSEELWDKGVLQGQGAAVSHLNDEIGKDYWLKVAQAKGLEGFVPGHDTLTAEKITDFGESEMVKQAKLGEAVGSGAISHEDEVVAARERLEQAYSQVGEQKPQISENFTQPIQPAKMEPTEVIKEAASPESQNVAVPYQEAVTAGNPYGLSAVAAEQVQRATEERLHDIFPENTTEAWGMVKNDSAHETILLSGQEMEEGHKSFVAFLNKLKEWTNLDPRPGTVLGGRAETNSEYIARAMQKLATIPGGLDKLKL